MAANIAPHSSHMGIANTLVSYVCMYSMNMVAYVICIYIVSTAGPPSHQEIGLAHQVKFLGLTQLVDQQHLTQPLKIVTYNTQKETFTAVRKLFHHNQLSQLIGPCCTLRMHTQKFFTRRHTKFGHETKCLWHCRQCSCRPPTNFFSFWVSSRWFVKILSKAVRQNLEQKGFRGQ